MKQFREYLAQRIIFDIVIQFTDKNDPSLRVEFSPGKGVNMLNITIKRKPAGLFGKIYHGLFGKELSYEISHNTLFHYAESLKMIVEDVEREFNTKIHPQVDQLK